MIQDAILDAKNKGGFLYLIFHFIKLEIKIDEKKIEKNSI